MRSSGAASRFRWFFADPPALKKDLRAVLLFSSFTLCNLLVSKQPSQRTKHKPLRPQSKPKGCKIILFLLSSILFIVSYMSQSMLLILCKGSFHYSLVYFPLSMISQSQLLDSVLVSRVKKRSRSSTEDITALEESTFSSGSLTKYPQRISIYSF